MVFELCALGSRFPGRCGVLGEILGDRKRGHGENLLVVHQVKGFLTQLIRMIDRDNTRARSKKSSGFTCRVDRDTLAYASRLCHRGAQLGFRVLEGSGEVPVKK